MSDCPTDHDLSSLIIGLLLFLGLFISYLPQHYRIIATGSSLGFSPWFLLLGCIGAWSNVVNILLLQSHVVGCCASIPIGLCFENLLGIMQILIVWIMFSLIVVLFVAYFPEGLKYQPSVPGVPLRDWRDTQLVLWMLAAYHILTALAALAFYVLPPDDEAARWFAGILGVVSMVVAAAQYLPQLVKTWETKIVGALSIPTMLMQSPGSFLLAYSLAIRPGVNWTSWITYFVSGTLQGVLLFMCIAWWLRENRMHAHPQPGYEPILNQEQDPASGGLYWEDSMVEDEGDRIIPQEELVADWTSDDHQT